MIRTCAYGDVWLVAFSAENMGRHIYPSVEVQLIVTSLWGACGEYVGSLLPVLLLACCLYFGVLALVHCFKGSVNWRVVDHQILDLESEKMVIQQLAKFSSCLSCSHFIEMERERRAIRGSRESKERVDEKKKRRESRESRRNIKGGGGTDCKG